MKLTTQIELCVETLCDEDLAKLSNDAAQEIRKRRVIKDTTDPEAKEIYYREFLSKFGKLNAIRRYMAIEKTGLLQAKTFVDALVEQT